MKRSEFIVLVILITFASNISAEEPVKDSPFSFGADIVSRYVFRGLDYGDSPAIQPAFNFSKNNFTVGAWGSYAFIATSTGIEADLFASYKFDFGLSAGITDYYFPDEKLTIKPDSTISPVRKGSYFDAGTHYDELNLTQAIKDFTIAANWGFHNMDNAVYFEAGYNFKWASVFLGGGNKIYTTNGNFNIVNIGVKASKEIPVTENYAFGISSALIFNPDAEQIHLVFALCL